MFVLKICRLNNCQLSSNILGFVGALLRIKDIRIKIEERVKSLNRQKISLDLALSLDCAMEIPRVSTGPKFGTRESWHINARYQVTEHDVITGTRHNDVIALGAWPMEYHQGSNKPRIWKTIKDDLTFDIPLRALESIDTDNLYAAGRLVDGDGGGGGSMRVMGTSFATGQAAGVAAALRSKGKGEISDIQSELERQGAILKADNLSVVETEAV